MYLFIHLFIYNIHIYIYIYIGWLVGGWMRGTAEHTRVLARDLLCEYCGYSAEGGAVGGGCSGLV